MNYQRQAARPRPSPRPRRRPGGRPDARLNVGQRLRASFQQVEARTRALLEQVRSTQTGRVSLLLALVASGLLAVAGISAIGLYTYYGRGLPATDELRHYRPPQITYVVDRKGRSIAEWFTERRTAVPMARVPRVMVLSMLAAEDADFYRHRGLDYAGLARAVLKDLTGGRRQGGSTITQQLIKTVWLGPERTFRRKFRELILTRRLESELTKDEILGMYLNQVNFGHARYGVEEAAKFYFNKHVEDLNLAEASLLAGIPQNPTNLSPINHPEAARKRQLFVLSQLEAKRAQYWDDLPLADLRKAQAEPVQLHPRENAVQSAPEVASLAKETLASAISAQEFKLGGFTLTTSLDLDVQNAARTALRKGLMRVDERHKIFPPFHAPKRPAKLESVPALQVGRYYDAVVIGSVNAEPPAAAPNTDKNMAAVGPLGELVLDIGGHSARASLTDLARWNPKLLTAAEFAEPGAVLRAVVDRVDEGETPARARLSLGPQGAVVVIDPRTREVVALVGGDEAIYGFNRALQAVRQPGSTWKPIEFALALDKHMYTPASLLLDAPEVFDEWKPNNYETWQFSGQVRLREALAQSINLVAIRLVNDLTPQAVVDFAKTLGVASPLDPTLALALGASGVKPIELVNAYATFAAGGNYMPPTFVRSIRDTDGKPVPSKPQGAPQQVMSPEGAYLITNMLTSVVQGGTGKAAMSLKRPLAGKTGTSNKMRDTWFVGYSPELVAGVWVGYDDLRPLGKNESGANTALPIWIELMKSVLADRPAVDFPVPAGIATAKIDPKSGKLAYDGQPDAIHEVFAEGTQPTEVASPPDELDTGSFMMQQLGADMSAQTGNGNETPPAPPL